ncbi:uncharacterized protein LOC131685205 isoform X2 [Topomyia yanbarensis]|uniref:uncharacterized protein LOC131685205 isoform X2 n=1 Tax=Topomyia yanbarensis TaxID=2498891 RepID=UPI00273B0DCB|nr:uncharacterized protein LOC131685205 isoform X2 [Topomyia yanbarensis]
MATRQHRLASMFSPEVNVAAQRRQSCSAQLPSPSVHVPSISVRLNGYPPRGFVAGNDRAVLMQNGGSGVRHCDASSGDGDLVNNSDHTVNDGGDDGVKADTGPLGIMKRICSEGILSAASTGSGSSSGSRTGNCWMLMITPVVSSFSVALVIAAVAGPQWLLTEEKIPNGNYNGTMNYNQKDEGIYLTKYTKSSLWMLCSKIGGSTLGTAASEFQCTMIAYFPQDDYNPDPHDSTNAIPYTVTNSSPFFFTSSVVLVISYVLFLVAMCSSGRKICYFVSGVLFIITGLVMLIGLIMFISILKAEIGSKLRPRSSLQAPLFIFRYGQSFLLYVFGFVITELSGILNVLIYSNLHQREFNRSQTYPTYQNLSGNFYNTTPKTDPLAPVSLYDGLRPRYYFDANDDCAVHRYRARQNLIKSLNELYTEPAPIMKSTATATSPPSAGKPVDISAPSKIEIMAGSGKLTRSVSTCTDIMLADEQKSDDEEGHSEENLKKICGISKQYFTKELSKEKLFNEFCKKVGPRPKPKNIYYIEEDGKNGDGFQNVFVIEGNNSDDDKFKRRRRNSMMEGSGRSDFFERRQRIKSDNSLDQAHAMHRSHDGLLRNNYEMRQTLPRNFMKKNHNLFAENEFDSDRGGFNSLDDLSDQTTWNRRISASGILEPVSSPYHNGSKWPKIIPKSTTDFISMQQKYLHVPSSPSYVDYSVRSPVQIHRSYGDLTTHHPQYVRFQHPSIAGFHYGAPTKVSPFTGKISPVFDLDKIESERRKSHSQLFLNSPSKIPAPLQHYDYVNGTAV